MSITFFFIKMSVIPSLHQNVSTFPLNKNVGKLSLLDKNVSHFLLYRNISNLQTLMPTLVWSTSKHDVYMAGNFKIIHWSGLSSKMTDVLDTAEHVTSSEVIII